MEPIKCSAELPPVYTTSIYHTRTESFFEQRMQTRYDRHAILGRDIEAWANGDGVVQHTTYTYTSIV